jgi:hypothetical protein
VYCANKSGMTTDDRSTKIKSAALPNLQLILAGGLPGFIVLPPDAGTNEKRDIITRIA